MCVIALGLGFNLELLEDAQGLQGREQPCPENPCCDLGLLCPAC